MFNAPSVLWPFDVSAGQTLFDGGRIQAGVDFSKGGYQMAVTNYRRTVLTAMQEGEDGISGVATLDRACAQAQTAIGSARRERKIAQQ